MTKCPPVFTTLCIIQIASRIKLNSVMQGNGNENGGSSLRLTEQQAAKLMEEDMGSAMQYLQSKGLCLMPISLASAISSTTSYRPSGGAGGPLHDAAALPPSPPLVNGACGDDSQTVKDAGTGDEQ
jgi:hypothetical protein